MQKISPDSHIPVRTRVPSWKVQEQQEEVKEPSTSSSCEPTTSCNETRKQRRSRTDYSTWSIEDRVSQERTYNNEYSRGYRERKRERNIKLENDLRELEKKNMTLKDKKIRIQGAIQYIRHVIENKNIGK